MKTFLRRALPLLLTFLAAAVLSYIVTPDKTPRASDFTLDAAAGPFTLSSLRGNVVLVYFGYASCPDICPTSLANLGTALSELTPRELAETRGVFVSLDPERDTPAELATYAAHFHPNIVGVTGADADIAEIAAQWGITYRRHGVDSALGYVVDHTSATFVVRPDGSLLTKLEHGTPPDDIVAAIRHAR